MLLHPVDHDFGISDPLMQKFRQPVAASFQKKGLPVLIMEITFQHLQDSQIIALSTFSRRIHPALDFSLPHNSCPFPQRSSIISSRWSSDMVPIFTYSLPGPAYKGRNLSPALLFQVFQSPALSSGIRHNCFCHLLPDGEVCLLTIGFSVNIPCLFILSNMCIKAYPLDLCPGINI